MKKVALALTFLLFSACSVAPKRSPERDQLTLTRVEVANKFYQIFLQSGQAEDLVYAETVARLAYREVPDDIHRQDIYYKTQFLRTALTSADDLSNLKALYQSLNPVLAQHLTPPNKIRYSEAIRGGKTTEEKIALIKEVIQEQPLFSDGWYELARLYDDSQHYWLALYPALKAVELNPEVAEFQFQAGYALESLVDQNECLYPDNRYLKAALPHYIAASNIQKNELYLDNSALIYLRLGLAPLAYRLAKESWAIKPNRWNSVHLAQAALLLGKFQQAADIATHAVTDHKAVEAKFILAAIAISRQQWDDAQMWLGRYLNDQQRSAPDGSDTAFFTSQALAWVNALAVNDRHHYQALNLPPQNRWSQQIAKALSLPVTSTQQPTLYALATNDCQRTEALFYEAMIAWLNGDTATTLEKLATTKNQGIPLFHETILAKALLQSKSLVVDGHH